MSNSFFDYAWIGTHNIKTKYLLSQFILTEYLDTFPCFTFCIFTVERSYSFGKSIFLKDFVREKKSATEKRKSNRNFELEIEIEHQTS